ncbi:GGDEF domain-containing protein [Oligoflexus tunisiensis]|uniref:GGDEF domain-containing protein n=1 Tax=Oligoflexus tunisiensis TaxID=708132 RepID=UPI000A4127A6|nr:GGDEF domain-containing protein [Oligoflexus tunisiensis]
MSKSKDQDESILLSPFEALFRDVLDYYSQTRNQIFKLEKWEYKTVFENVIKARFGGDARKALDRLRESFHETRAEETAHGKRYLTDLRGLMWQGMDQIFTLLDAHQKDDGLLLRMRTHLQKALVAQDLASVKQTVKEVLTSLTELEKARQKDFEGLQNSFQKQMETLQSELQMVQSQLQLDGMTHVYNRATFDQQIRKTAQFSFLTGQKSCLIMFDIDHFKKINDSYGHPAGDAVITAFARTLTQSFPRKTDFVARYGGEEFAVLLQGTDLNEGQDLALRLLGRVRTLKISHNDQDLAITVSAGVALFQVGESVEQWLKRADKALYDAKQQGRDRLILAA